MNNNDFKELNLEKFHHKLTGRVKFAEVDAFGVVHNIQYLYWLEWARLEYFRAIGIPVSKDTFIREYRFMVVHAEIDYLGTAGLNDEYEILTRVDSIKNSSLQIENIIKHKNGNFIAIAKAVIVHLNDDSLTSEPIPEDVRYLVNKYESK